MFKSVCVAVSVAVAALSLGALPQEALAKRLGGGKPAGMQRATPQQAPGNPQAPAQAQPGTPAQQPHQAAAPAPAQPQPAAPKRSWLGPLAGLAAGLGIAALLSHFGLGEAFANAMMMGLVVMLVLVVGLWLLRKFTGGGRAAAQGPQLAGAGAPWGGAAAQPQPVQQPTAFEAAGAGLGATAAAGAAAAAPLAAANLPADFDAQGFERAAKMIFIRLQAANDSGDVEDLRRFTTPELFASLRLDLQERNGARQQTDVVQLNAQLADWATEGGQNVASVRFSGLIREEAGAAAAPFDELWHLVRPADASRDWLIAGITPLA